MIFGYLEAALLEDHLLNSVNKPDLCILTALSSCAAAHGKSYCFPAQDTILTWLARAGRRMSRRTLNRHLRALECQGWIKRRRRHRHDARRGMVFCSTLYEFTRRAFRWIAGLMGAVKRAVSWGRSRVPDPAHYIPYRDILGRGRTLKIGGAPPGGEKKVAGGMTAGDWDKKKTAARPHLDTLKQLLGNSRAAGLHEKGRRA